MEVLRSPDLPLEMDPLDIPLAQVRTQVLSNLQRERLETAGITTFGELVEVRDPETFCKDTNFPLLTLQKLISAVELIIKGSKHQTPKKREGTLNFIKIVFFGLDQAGKTSLIRFIKRKEPLVALKEKLDARPTVGVDMSRIKFQELPIVLTELGGQRVFREAYAKDLEKYFSETQLAVFVVDCLNLKRLQEAIEFLKVVYPFLNTNHILLRIAIHKADGGALEESQTVATILQKISEEVHIPIVDLLGSVHTTSVKEPASISAFFSQIIEEHLPIRSYITTGLQTLSALYPLDFCCLVDPKISRLPLGWVTKPHLDAKTIINHVLNLTEVVIGLDLTPLSDTEPHYTVKIGQWIREMWFLPIKLANGSKDYLFIYCYADDHENILDSLPSLKELTIKAIEPQLRMALLAINTGSS